MDKSTRNSAIAAAIIVLGFGLVAFLMPRIMLAVGSYSPSDEPYAKVGICLAWPRN